MSLRLLRLAAGLLLAASLPALAPAQCPQPDGLDGGPCCKVTSQKLPQFPAIKQETWDICWRDCNIDFLGNCIAEWSPPATSSTVSCGPLASKLRLRDAAGTVKWRGEMRLQYSRTWLETDPTGLPLQVWRFLVNGDLTPSAAAGPVPCPVPPCAKPNHRLVRFTGYIDYAYDCQNGKWSPVWMLTHGCDQFEHHQGFPRAGLFHPDRAYSFVGPAPQFAPGPVVPAEGGASPFEAVRNIRIAGPPGTVTLAACTFEEQIQHALNPHSQFCACGATAGLPQYMVGDLFVGGSCGTSINPGSALLPGFISMGIGTWVDPTKYPGQEILRWNVGGYIYSDGCTGVTDDEVFFGVSTLGGWPALQILASGAGAPLPLIFVDQANSLRSSKTVMNVPFHSSHILNLNH